MNMKVLDDISPYGHWLLRLALGSVFLVHGLGKFLHLNQAAASMEMPVTMVVLLALMETGGAVFVLLGGFLKDWMTRLGALLLVPPMLGAIVMVHWGQWVFMPTESHKIGGIEFPLTLLLIQLYLLIKGNTVNVGKAVSASN